MENNTHLVRVTIRENPDDKSDGFRYAAKVRRDLWAYSDSDIDPEHDRNRTLLDKTENPRPYFEFTTEDIAQVEQALARHDHKDRTILEDKGEVTISRCAKCGFDAGPGAASICSCCGFRDIDPCPNCGREIARVAYHSIEADVFECPVCCSKVQFSFSEPMVDEEDNLNQPLVLVTAVRQGVEAIAS